MKVAALWTANLIIDATDARAAADSFRAAGLTFTGAVIHGGDTVTSEGGYTRIPKRDLVNNLQVLLHQKRFEFTRDLPHSTTVAQEALNFQMKINDKAHDSYGAWREGTHDDLLFAVMLAAWKGARRTSGPPSVFSMDGRLGSGHQIGLPRRPMTAGRR